MTTNQQNGQCNANALQTTNNNVPSIFNFFDPVQFETMQRISTLFANSELVPDMYKITETNPKEKATANCMIAVDISQRIGASPLMVMQNLVIIYGKPSWSAKFLISTVNTCGRFEPLQFRFTEKGMLGMVDYVEHSKVWKMSSTGKKYAENVSTNKQFDGQKIMDIECVAFTTKKGSERVLESSPVTIRMAIQEGWYLKNGSKWQTMPKQMLIYRAASFWTNAYAPEISMGMKTVEEVQDIHSVEDAEYEDVTDKVDNEKKENANKSVINVDMGKGDDTSNTTTVDTETGEIKGATPDNQQQSAAAPGF